MCNVAHDYNNDARSRACLLEVIDALNRKASQLLISAPFRSFPSLMRTVWPSTTQCSVSVNCIPICSSVAVSYIRRERSFQGEFATSVTMDSKLYAHPLFTIRNELLSPEDRIRVTYERAKLVVQTWSMYCAGSSKALRSMTCIHRRPQA